jgi:hypothetical protein
MLSHTTTVNEWVPPTKTGVVKVVGAPDIEVALLSKNTVTWPIVRAWPVVYVVGFVQVSVTLLVGGLVCAIAGATTSAAKIGKRANWFIVLLLFMFLPARPWDHSDADIDFNPAPPRR